MFNRPWAGAVALILLIAALTHGAAIQLAPHAMTEYLLEGYRANGLKPNQLRVSGLKKAATMRIPMANADTVTIFAEIDTDQGPLRLEGPPPGDAVYWSISLFAHNTDVFFVGSDRFYGDRPPGVTIVGPRQTADPAEGVWARSPSRTAVLIFRATMPDRNDQASVAAIEAALRQWTLVPVKS